MDIPSEKSYASRDFDPDFDLWIVFYSFLYKTEPRRVFVSAKLIALIS